MKVVALKTFVVSNPVPLKGGANWVFLKLTTDEGIVGYGEASSSQSKEHTMVRLIEEIGEQYVIGANPFNIERLWKTMYTNVHVFRHPDLMRLPAMAAFEMACWDIVGKALNQPIYNLIGGKYNDKLRAYSYMYDYGRDAPRDVCVKLAAERALQYVEMGFTAIGFDPIFPYVPNPRDYSLEEIHHTENVFRAVREAVGDRCDILFKAHGQFTTHTAIRIAKRLEQFDLMWFEEPVPPENVDEMARVARSTSIPIATGERLSTKYEFREVLEKQAAAILQPSMGAVGGILEAKKVAGMAEAHYAQVAPWVFMGPIGGAAAIQLSTCSPNFIAQEGIEDWSGFVAEILKEPIRWEKGYIIPPTGPGLGVELNEEVAAKHPYAAPPR